MPALRLTAGIALVAALLWLALRRNDNDPILPEPPSSAEADEPAPDLERVQQPSDLPRATAAGSAPDPRVLIRVTNTRSEPIHGARIAAVAALADRFHADHQLLAHTDTDGVAWIDPIAGLPDVVVHHPDHLSAGIEDVARVREHEVTLRDGLPFVGRVQLRDGTPIAGAELVLSGTARIPLTRIDAIDQPLVPGTNPRDAIHRAISDADGRVTVHGLPSQAYAAHLRHPRYCWTARRSELSGIRVPGREYVFVMTEPIGAVLEPVGDRVVFCNIGNEGPGMARLAHGWNSSQGVRAVSKNLLRRFPPFPISIATIEPVRPDHVGETVARFQVFFERHGWHTFRVPMVPISALEATRVQLPALPVDALPQAGTVNLTIRQPDGDSFELESLPFRRVEAEQDIPVIVGVTTGTATSAPPGEYRLFRAEYAFLVQAVGRDALHVERGTDREEVWPLSRRLGRYALRVRGDIGAVGDLRIIVRDPVLGEQSFHSRDGDVLVLPQGALHVEIEATGWRPWAQTVATDDRATTIEVDLVAK